MSNNMYFSNRSIFGNNKYLFYVLIGARGVGKTFSTQNYCLRRFIKYGEKFIWLRLNEAATKKLLQNNAKDFIDSKLVQKWGITGTKVEGNTVLVSFDEEEDEKEKTYIEMCRIMALSTFYTVKGVAMNKTSWLKPGDDRFKKRVRNTTDKFRIIVLDEMNREKSEKRSFDICYAFVNQLENICRLDTDRRIILMGNTLEEASDVMAGCFNFIPNNFGTYKLKKKRAIINYIDDGEEYKKARAESIAGILTPDESTFTNTIQSDMELLIPTGRVAPGLRPSYILYFSNNTYFTVYDNIITRNKVPTQHGYTKIALVPYLVGMPYYKEQARKIIELAQQRIFKFDKLITLKLFYKEIKEIKA